MVSLTEWTGGWDGRTRQTQVRALNCCCIKIKKRRRSLIEGCASEIYTHTVKQFLHKSPELPLCNVFMCDITLANIQIPVNIQLT